MSAATAEALSAWLERDPNYIPLTTRERYDSTAKPAERAAAANAQDPDLLLSVHGNSAPEGSSAAGFEMCIRDRLCAMAQCGFLIPADERSEICVFDEFLVDIGDAQSIEQSPVSYTHLRR